MTVVAHGSCTTAARVLCRNRACVISCRDNILFLSCPLVYIFASKLCFEPDFLVILVGGLRGTVVPVAADGRHLMVRYYEYCGDRGSKTIGGLKQPVQPVKVRRRNLREGTIYADAHHLRSLRG